MRAWTYTLAAVLLALGWQWTTVRANYGGNWTALYCTGGLQPLPPLIAAEHVYVFANSTGYDGQFYHYIAHDPLLRTDARSYLDDARLRYRRILVPLAAYALALGRTQWVDPAYRAVCLIAIGLGVYWSCLLACSMKRSPAWGLVFLAMPAIAITLDRLVVDAALAALTVAAIYYSREPSWKLFVVLVCAALTRETGFLLVAACCAHLAWKRDVRRAAVFAATALPAIGWFLYVQHRTAAAATKVSVVPLAALWRALTSPATYPAGMPFAAAVHTADYLALAGAILACALTFRYLSRDFASLAAALFAAMALTLAQPYTWLNVYDYGRVYAPLLICLAAVAARTRSVWLLAPAAMMLPRIAMQFTPQFLGILPLLSL